MGERLGYEVEVSWAGGAGDGSYDVLFWQKGMEGAEAELWQQILADGREQEKERHETRETTEKTTEIRRMRWEEYGNNPLQGKWGQKHVPRVREALKERLPEYMLPTAYVVLEAIPLTPNGKVDRKALPAPDNIRPDLREKFVMPQTAAEKMLAEIWRDVLTLDKVGVNDNFFELGGNSLLVIQVWTQLRQRVQREIKVVEMFQFPTIASMAKNLSEEEAGKFSMQKFQDRAQRRRASIARHA
jgi:hypothetical protein